MFILIVFLIRLRVLSSGIKSFELTNRNAKKDLQEITNLVSMFICLYCIKFKLKVETTKSMSADQLANHLGIPVIVARERYYLIIRLI
jgi:thioredoxin-related protein